MIRLQLLTACRPGEICIVRPQDVDTSGPVWLFQPERHKTEHHNHSRFVAIGSAGQDMLRKYLLRPAESYCFSPVDAERERRETLHEMRKTPIGYGNPRLQLPKHDEQGNC